MTRLGRSHVIASALAITLAVGGTAFAQGHFELDGIGQSFDEVSAFSIRSRNNPGGHDTMVLLTTTAPDRAAIRDADDPYAVAINDPATAGDLLTVVVRGDGTVTLNADIGGVQYVDSSGRILGTAGSLAADCNVNTAEHVACVVHGCHPLEVGKLPLITNFLRSRSPAPKPRLPQRPG